MINYFYHTRSERRGVITLLVCIAAVGSFKFFRLKPNVVNNSTYNENWAQLSVNFQNKPPDEGGDTTTTLLNFDPNTASLDALVQAGMPPRVATILMHYREKGGRFKSKEDLRKVYGVTEALYATLKGRILIGEISKSNDVRNNRPTSGSKFNVPDEKLNNVTLKNFDPNTVTEPDLLQMGIPLHVVKIWLNYRTAGKIFRKKQDVEKIYGITPEIFSRIENFIQITENQFVANKSVKVDSWHFVRKETLPSSFKLDLNTATIDDLLRLHGIGHTFATSILKYRTELGGFYAVKQLKEIDYFPDSTYNSLAPSLFLSAPILPLHINKTNHAELNHPYLSKKQILGLERYKVNHGNFKSMADVNSTGLFNAQQLEKLKPYLAFDE